MPGGSVRYYDTRVLFIHIVRTVVDDSVHIKIKTVEFRNPILSNELRDGWIPLTQPPEKFWYALRLNSMN